MGEQKGKVWNKKHAFSNILFDIWGERFINLSTKYLDNIIK